VAESGPSIALDRVVRDRVRDLVARADPAWLDTTMHTIADLGGPIPAGTVLAAAALFTAFRLRRGYPVPLALGSAAVVTLVVIGGKDLIGRPGPGGSPVAADQWGFFPSGHTATSTVCYGLGALLLGRVVSAPTRRRLHVGAGVLCAVIGFSLLWCDYHWLADVLAAWALCGIVLWAAALVPERARLRTRPPAAPPPPSPRESPSSSDR
jgi:undecaprenyl-diphosphatase